jgi:hypothetical protein
MIGWTHGTRPADWLKRHSKEGTAVSRPNDGHSLQNRRNLFFFTASITPSDWAQLLPSRALRMDSWASGVATGDLYDVDQRSWWTRRVWLVSEVKHSLIAIMVLFCSVLVSLWTQSTTFFTVKIIVVHCTVKIMPQHCLHSCENIIHMTSPVICWLY